MIRCSPPIFGEHYGSSISLLHTCRKPSAIVIVGVYWWGNRLHFRNNFLHHWLPTIHRRTAEQPLNHRTAIKSQKSITWCWTWCNFFILLSWAKIQWRGFCRKGELETLRGSFNNFRAKPNLILTNGNSEEWIAHFKLCADINKWDDEQKSQHLHSCVVARIVYCISPWRPSRQNLLQPPRKSLGKAGVPRKKEKNSVNLAN